MEKGFNKEYLALSVLDSNQVLLDFPLQIILGYWAAKWSSGDRPLKPWSYGFVGRLLSCLAGMAVVRWYPENGVTPVYFSLVIAANMLSSFFNTLQFVGMGSFFTSISDPAIGGTYVLLTEIDDFTQHIKQLGRNLAKVLCSASSRVLYGSSLLCLNRREHTPLRI